MYVLLILFENKKKKKKEKGLNDPFDRIRDHGFQV